MRLLVAVPTLKPQEYIKPHLLLPEHEWLLLDNHETGYPVQDIANARNFALKYARTHNFNQLLFLDSDVEPIITAYELLNNTEADVVYGWVYFKSRGDFSMKTFDEEREFTAAAVCMLIKEKPLQDSRLSFNVVDTSTTEDINYLRQAQKLGYCLTVQKKCYCLHHYDRVAYRFKDGDLQTWIAITVALNYCFPNMFFWQILKQIRIDQVKILENVKALDDGGVFTLQTAKDEFVLLSGHPNEGDTMTVSTPVVPLKITGFEQFLMIGMVNSLRPALH